jgi:hypothetical protein
MTIPAVTPLHKTNTQVELGTPSSGTRRPKKRGHPCVVRNRRAATYFHCFRPESPLQRSTGISFPLWIRVIRWSALFVSTVRQPHERPSSVAGMYWSKPGGASLAAVLLPIICQSPSRSKRSSPCVPPFSIQPQRVSAWADMETVKPATSAATMVNRFICITRG